MAFFLRAIFGGDHSEFMASTRAVESEASRVAGRTGAILKAQTRGFRDFSGAILGGTALIGMASGAVMGIVVGLDKALTYQSRMNDAVRAERDRRFEVMRGVEDQVRAMKELLGLQAPRGEFISALEARAAAIAKEIEQTQKLRDEAGKAHSASLAFASVLEQVLSGTDHVGDNPDKFNTASWRRVIEIQETMREQAEALREVYAQIGAAEEADRAAAAERERVRALQEGNAVLRQRIELARAMGDEEEALRLEEQLRHAEALEAINKLYATETARYREAIAREQEIHQRRLANIAERMAAERRRAAEEQAERERMNGLNNRAQQLQLDADLARAQGDETTARMLEEEIRLMREIEAIRRAEGLSEEERQRRIRQAEEISRLRRENIERSAAEAAKQNGSQRGESVGIEAGIAKTDALMRQVMGQRDPDAARWDKQTSQIDRILEYLRQSAERARSQPMLTLM